MASSLPPAKLIPITNLSFISDEDGQHLVLGAGSFATTYKATFCGKDHAVKMAKRPPPGHPEAASWEETVAAFVKEATLQYSLRDDNVVPLAGYVLATDEHRHVKKIGLVMKFAAGGSLQGWLAGPGRAATQGARLRLLLDAARGLHYLHSQGSAGAVIHGDLKPANVLLEQGCTGAMLADLGLSRVRDSAAVARTSLYGARGTPLYMAPELRHGVPLSTACDMYSFAIMAWETVTGEEVLRAFLPTEGLGRGGGGGQDTITLLYQAVDAGVRPQAGKVGDAALAAFLQRAWHRDPRQRPTSAELLAELERAAAAGATLRPPPGGGHVVEPYPQGRALALMFVDEREARFPALRARLASSLEHCGYDVQYFGGRRIQEDALAAIAAASPVTLSRVVLVYNGHGCKSSGHPMGLLNGGWSRDNARLYTGVKELEVMVNALIPKGVPKVFILDCCYSDSSSDSLPPPWKDQKKGDSVHDMAILRASSMGHLAWASESWGLSTCIADALDRRDGISLDDIKYLVEDTMRAHRGGVIEPELGNRMGRPFTFVHQPGGSGSAAGGAAGGAAAVSASVGGAELTALMWRLQWLIGSLRARGVARVIAELAAQVRWERAQGAARAAEAKELALLHQMFLMGPQAFEGEDGPGNVAPQALGRLGGLGAASGGPRVRALLQEAHSWDGGGRAWLRPVRPNFPPVGGACQGVMGHAMGVSSVCALSEGRLATGSYDCRVRVWDGASGLCVGVLDGHDNSVLCVCALGGGRLVSGSADCTLRVWEVASGGGSRELLVLRGHSKPVMCVCAARDGQHIVSGAGDGTLRVWSAATGACVRVLEGHASSVTCVCALGDGRVVSGSEDGTLRVWGLAAGAAAKVLRGHTSSVTCVCALEDGRIVSGAAVEGVLRVWEAAAAGACVSTVYGLGGVTSLCPAGGTRIVSASRDKALGVWDVGSGEFVRELTGHAAGVHCVCACPGGRIASASEDTTLRLWDATLEPSGRALVCDPSARPSMAVLRDGRIASFAAGDDTVRLWEGATGAQLEDIEGGTQRAAEVRAHSRQLTPALPGTMAARQHTWHPLGGGHTHCTWTMHSSVRSLTQQGATLQQSSLWQAQCTHWN